MAINIDAYNIFSMPRMIKNRRQSLKKIARTVPRFSVRKLQKILKGRIRFTWIARQIELNLKQVAEIEKLSGFFLEKTTKRLYPNHELMAQILGFVGIDNVGLAGVEYSLNELLKGDIKIVKYLRDAKGRPIKFESYDTEKPLQNVHLSLDKDIQAVAEKHLKQAVEKHQALRGGVGVMDADKGEVLAMANYPSFDPNRLKDSKGNHRKLSFVTDPFEPGSVFKIFTVASALENKVVTTETNYFCEYGKFKVGSHTIKESSRSRKYEWLSVSDIIKYSSNIGTVKIAFDLTFPLLDKTIRDFGFGQKTGIEFPGESRGIYHTKHETTQLSLSNLSFGQGVAVTGLQILAAYGAIANGGIYHAPSIIKAAQDKDKVARRVISSHTAQQLQTMLVAVVEDGTAKNIKIPYFKIAGKTGTAQKVNAEGAYTGYVSNFVGFPVGVEKKFVVYAYVDEPGGKIYSGSRVAAPIVKKIIEYLLFKNREYQNLAINLGESNPVSIDLVENAPLRGNASRGEMPNFIGLDKKSSFLLARKIGIYLEHQGVGIVVKQNIKEGTPVAKNSVVILEHRPPRHE